MTAVALRGLLTRKLRTVLTMIAIILGVSMIAGTYVLTDTINNSFSQIFHTADRTIDVIISSKAPVEAAFRQPPPFPDSLLNVVRSTPGVAVAEGEIGDQVELFRPNGKQIGGLAGPTLLFSRPTIARFRTLTVIRGHEPHGNELLVDESTANRNDLKIGQKYGIVAAGPMRLFTLVGITRFGTVSSIGGATIISVDLQTAQSITNKVGEFDQISVLAAPGVSSTELVRRIQARIPPSLRDRIKVQTSSQSADDQTQAIQNGFLNILTYALLAFGGIAVFVGAFIIFNTFSITVAQRTREFGMLRTNGATRGQVLRSVILEALVIGLLASIIGLVAGLGIAKALNALFVAFGVDLPNAGMVVETRTILVALLVGTLVTVLASLMPAIRATRVPPVAALREGSQLPRGRFARYSPYVATILTALGIAGMALGIFASISSTGQRLSLIGLGAVVLFIGVAMLSPKLIRPLANVLGWPIDRMTNITGKLARENVTRNPTRTAVTAAALMIGLALVGFVTIFAAELRLTVDDAVNRELVGTYAVYATQNFIPQGVAPALAKVPGMAAVSAVKYDNARIDGIGTVTTSGVQPATLGRLYRVQWKVGSASTLAHMGPYNAIVSDDFANSHNLKVGSVLHVTTPASKHDTFTVTGIYKKAQFFQNWCVRYDIMARDWALYQDRIDFVLAAPGQNLTSLEQRISSMLQANFPVAQVYSQQQVKDQQNQSINQLLALIYILLALSVIVSLFGIINTLVLSVYERTREIGLLRAIGTTRGQVRWMIRWESVITSVIGAILGLALGIVFALLITKGLASQNLEYTIPVTQLLIWVVFAMIFGIVAAAFPARRAARLDVLQAVAYE
jgi:putative ABC transport system permease protein